MTAWPATWTLVTATTRKGKEDVSFVTLSLLRHPFDSPACGSRDSPRKYWKRSLRQRSPLPSNLRRARQSAARARSGTILTAEGDDVLRHVGADPRAVGISAVDRALATAAHGRLQAGVDARAAAQSIAA